MNLYILYTYHVLKTSIFYRKECIWGNDIVLNFKTKSHVNIRPVSIKDNNQKDVTVFKNNPSIIVYIELKTKDKL